MLVESHCLCAKIVSLHKHRIVKLLKAPNKKLSRADVLEAKRLWLMESQIALSEHNGCEIWKKQFRLLVRRTASTDAKGG